MPLTESVNLVLANGQKVPVDLYRSNVSLLLHGDGTNGSTTITDSSPTPKTVTVAGNAQISTAQSKFGGASIAFDGNGDWLSLSSNPGFQFGTGDFTIETWARFNVVSDQLLYDTIPVGGLGSRLSGFAFVLQSTGRLNVFSNNGFKQASTITLSANTWYHIALVRSGNVWTYYVDGNSAGTYNQSIDITDSTVLIGRIGDSNIYHLNCNLDDFRVTKGTARYQSTFTPPTAPFPDF